GLLTDRERALVKPLRLAVLALSRIDHGQVVETLSHSRLVHPLCVERLGLAVLALGLIHDRQIVEGLSHIRVARIHGLSLDRAPSLLAPLGLQFLPLVSYHVGYVVQGS